MPLISYRTNSLPPGYSSQTGIYGGHPGLFADDVLATGFEASSFPSQANTVALSHDYGALYEVPIVSQYGALYEVPIVSAYGAPKWWQLRKRWQERNSEEEEDGPEPTNPKRRRKWRKRRMRRAMRKMRRDGRRQMRPAHGRQNVRWATYPQKPGIESGYEIQDEAVLMETPLNEMAFEPMPPPGMDKKWLLIGGGLAIAAAAVVVMKKRTKK